MSDVLSFLDTYLGSHKVAGSKHTEILFTCPFCHHHKPKLAINIATGNWHCWVCNVGGRTLFSLLKKRGASRAQFQELSKALDLYVPVKVTVHDDTPLVLPAEYRPLWESSRDYEYRNALYYCAKRGLTNDDILRYQLGYCSTGEYAGRVIIPSYDANGQLNFFSGRSYFDSQMPYKNPPVSKNIIGFESLVSWKFPIVICEGPMDAMAIKRNAIPLFGKTIPPNLLKAIFVNEVTDIYLVLDTDALKQSARLAEEFMNNGSNVYLVRLDGKDPNEIGFQKVNTYIRTTQKMTFNLLQKLKVGLLQSS